METKNKSVLGKMLTNPISTTRGVYEAMKAPTARNYVQDCIEQFFAGNYGTMPPPDVEANRRTMAGPEGRIIGRYSAKGILEDDLYIIAYFSLLHDEQDYNYTTVMYCNEY